MHGWNGSLEEVKGIALGIGLTLTVIESCMIHDEQ